MDLYKAGKVDDAIAAFRQAVAADPKNSEALTNLGLALDSRGQRRRSCERLQQSADDQSLNSIAQSDLALALYHEKKYAGLRSRRIRKRSR